MKSVLTSIQPYYVFLIIARLMGWSIPQDKTVEVRKDFPKDAAWNKRVHIYCSKNRKSFNRIPAQYQPFMEKFLGTVVGEFVCDYIYHIPNDSIRGALNGLFNWWNDYELEKACVDPYDLDQYAKGEDIYGWYISELKIYDKPKELGEFNYPCPKGFHDINNYRCWREWGNKLSQCKYNDMKNSECRNQIIRPPQSWCYCEV